MSAFPSDFGSGFNPNQSFEDLITGFSGGAAAPTRQTLAQKARNLGYSIQPGQDVARGRLGRFPTSAHLSNFATPAPINPLDRVPPILLQALARDTAAMQSAADEQYARNNEQIAGIGGLVNSIVPSMTGQSDALAAILSTLAGQAQGLGLQQVGDVTTRVNDLFGQVSGNIDQFQKNVRGQAARGIADVNADVNSSYKLGDNAVAGFENAIRNFQDRSAQDAASTASGIRRSMQSAMNEIRSGVNPDGTPMTPAEKQAAILNLQRTVGDQVDQTVTGYFSDYNKARAALEQNLASLRMNNAGLRQSGADIKLRATQTGLQAEQLALAGEQLRAQTGLQGNEQIIEAQKGQREMMDLSSNLMTFMASMKESSLMNALNLEMQGRTTMAQLVQQNPRSVVSWFQGLLALYATAAGQGGGSSGGGGGGTGQRSTNGGNGGFSTGQLLTGGNNPMGRNTVNMPGNAYTRSPFTPPPSNQPANSAIGNIQDPSYA